MRLLLKLLTVPALVTVAACSSAPSTEDNTSTSEGEEALTSNESAAFQFFVSKGLTHAQAAGIVGNLIQESNVLPGAVQYGGGPGRGIAQWSVGGRWNASYHDNMVWFAGVHGLNPWSLQAQLEFIWYELTTFGYGYSKLRAAGNVAEATIVFQDDYEICGACNQSGRIAYANQVLAAYGGGGGGGGASCYSPTLGKRMPEDACVQSRSNRLWYECNNGTWVDRWHDPSKCNGVYPL